MSIPSVIEMYDKIQPLINQDVDTIRKFLITALSNTTTILELLNEGQIEFSIRAMSAQFATETDGWFFNDRVRVIIKQELGDKGMDLSNDEETDTIHIIIKKDPSTGI